MAAEDLIVAAQAKLESLLADINGGVGEDASYDERFDALKVEVDKLTSLEGAKVDWGSIANHADEILSEKSKDFRLAVYYAAAKSHTEALPGILQGLVLIRDLDAKYWDTMFPPIKRPKVRGNLMQWYSDLVGPIVANFTPTGKDADLMKALDEVSRAVDGDLRDKLAENYGGISQLRQAVKNVLSIVPKEAPPPPPPPPPKAAPAPSDAQEAAPPPPADAGPSASSITGPDSAMEVISQVGVLLVRSGDALRAADPGNPLAYRFSRTGMWMDLNQAPTAEGGQTLVPSPPSGLREQMDSYAAAENWMGLIQFADETAAEYILWLDPHRYIANAMDRLGAIFINAKKALLREIAVMLLRVPAMSNLSFNDGTPFADGQTKMWLEAEVQSIMGSGGGGGGGGGPASALDGPIAEGRTLAASGKLPEAIELVAKASATAPSPSERFKGRLALAKLCLQAEQFVIARAQLEGLDRLVEAHRLDEWEPELCAELYASLYAAHRGMSRVEEPAPEVRAREILAFQKLCQLDAGSALKIMTAQ